MILESLIYLTDTEHGRRVSEISGILAAHTGYPPDTVRLIRRAALYHDIGKNDIDRSILDRPGSLTAQEYRTVKTHTQLGAKSIEDVIAVLAAAQIICKQHHERLDGSGYLGLPGDRIHPFAKLVAIADVYDALVSKRVYKPRLDVCDVIKHFKDNSGTLYDAALVDVLISNLNEITGLYR